MGSRIALCSQADTDAHRNHVAHSIALNGDGHQFHPLMLATGNYIAVNIPAISTFSVIAGWSVLQPECLTGDKPS
jgi:hypothetical protein